MSSETRTLIDAVNEEFRLYQNATDEFDEVAAQRLGINRTDLRCTDIIERHGRMTAGELAREAGLTTGAVTNVLDRLEKLGRVRRVRDKEDRRRVQVELTEKAIRLGQEIWGPLARASRAALARFSDAELEFIRDFLRGSREFTARQTERVRGRRRRQPTR